MTISQAICLKISMYKMFSILLPYHLKLNTKPTSDILKIEIYLLKFYACLCRLAFETFSKYIQRKEYHCD